ncbi:PTS sugar transporter subunit IIC [Oenococcus sicerae]|uniref:Permease IIC component n=1 Tax=Oenococcus sicerae TaxID=2203724 RepID=A0AAJ1R943_9LACO|nr:PTS sugar transporter subunit IIC [Oenococcus sicerae]MDN6900016.1 PTS sugar transporter subunit IIC [Oenococcus sicerae]QAS69626.1 PTS sugar transporter subunit IIC [Oenococcus sicerae]
MNTFINKRVLPPVMKFVNTKALTALKDGMVVSLPFIMVGSVFLLLSSFPYAPIADWMTKTGLAAYFSQAYNASFGIVSIFAVVGIAYVWVKNEGYEPLPAGMTALVSFILIMHPTTAVMNGSKTIISATQAPTLLGGFIDRTWLGGQGMIAAIIVGMITGWIYSWFIKHKITIKLPEQVPPAVSNSFIALIPAFVIVVFWLLVYILFDAAAHETMTQWIYQVVQIPLQGLTDSFGGVLVVALAVPFFWFFGVHGAIIVSGIMSPILQANALSNAAIFKAHGIVTATNGGHIFIQPLMDQFGTVTGSGMTIGLVIFMTFFAKSAQMKGIGKLSLVPGLFNINEPTLFGLPIVLNPLLALPFILMPALSMLSTYLLIQIHVLPYLTGVMVPWTTPPIISGFLIGGWKVAIWQTVVLIASFFVYFPFARRYDKILYEEEQAKETQLHSNK